MKFRKILVANRGEIAVRVMRACEELGIRTVSIYSNDDEKSFFFRLADEYAHLPGKSIADTYLNIELLVDTARKFECDAIHPGYGFLSENPEFVEACEDAGIVFIGPSASTMKKTADKEKVKAAMSAAGIPVLPSLRSGCPAKKLKAVAEKIGYPAIVKPAFGGGGKGMRIVRGEGDLEDAMRYATSMGASMFGKDTFYVEKYLENPRHIEVQILADRHGNISDLGERECSIQRRHQKLIEETPSPALSDKQRKEIAALARRAAAAVGYINAGTIEFLYEEGKFYFLEVNSRIQVEHAVTEMVTGIDIVKEQIQIAEGHELSFTDRSVKPTGWAIECRVNAEDPHKNFLPSPGRLKGYRSPGGVGVRVDSGVFTGFSIPPQFDSLVAKLTVWGRTREEAIARMKRALKEYVIFGIKTTLPLYRAIIREGDFKKGIYTTNYIDEHHDTLMEMMDRIKLSRKFYTELLESVFKRAPYSSPQEKTHVDLTGLLDSLS